MNNQRSTKEKAADIFYVVIRIAALFIVCCLFFPFANPAYIFSKADAALITNTTSVFTGAVSYSNIVNGFGSAFRSGLIEEGPFRMLWFASILITLGSAGAGAAACMTLGNTRMKHLGSRVLMLAAVVLGCGTLLIFSFYNGIPDMIKVDMESGSEESNLSVKLSEQTNKTTAGEGVDLTQGNVYEITISNQSGDALNGWAVEIEVGEDFDVNNIKVLNKWFMIGQKEVKYVLHYEMQGNNLVITPDNFRLEEMDGEPMLTTSSDASDTATAQAVSYVAAGANMRLTLVADNFSVDAPVTVTEGGLDQPFVYAFPSCVYLYIVVAVLLLVLGLVTEIILPKAEAGEPYHMETKYQLFLMYLPFILLIAAFAYLPLYGWRYAFFEDANKPFSAENFAKTKWFTILFSSPAYRTRFLRVMRNTLAMSGLGILTSWIPMAFAIFLNEIKSTRFRRFVQTFSTIPNFISWVLVYAIAFAIFSTDGFINSILGQNYAYLEDANHLWLKMLAWGTWKGVGWSAIIYISGIAGIDQQLYEAATVDGAGRFQRMWHITLPGLLPTYIVMLVMSIAGILSNGMDQYLVFSNPRTAEPLEVLDLYTYNLGIASNLIPMSTVVGMGKSIISIILFFVANSAAKAIRGDGIV